LTTPPDAGAGEGGEPAAGVGTPKPGLVGSVKARVSSTRDDLERRRSTSRFIDAAFGSVQHEASVGGGLLAGAVAFRFFLLIVPYVFVVVFGFGLTADVAGTDPQDLARKTGIVGLVASAISSGGEASTFTRIVTFVVALYALVTGARNMVKATRAVHALIWRVPLVPLRRPTLAGIFFIGAFTAMVVLIALLDRLRHGSPALWIVGTVLFVLVPAGVWLLCSIVFFPSETRAGWRDLWPGAFLMGVGLEGLHVATVVWIARSLESKSETYGAIGAALTILLWAYILGRLVTASTSLNAVIWASRHRAD
jgi:uncharacterized BrkB/YihY/UPF0761 family membrane protein